MAWSGWSINATPTFRGLSYDEWAKPLEQATKLHQEVETQYGELDAKASMWDKLANDVGGKDSKAYKQYKKYADDLRAQADELAKNGLGYNSRKNMLNMVGRYSKEITPIEEAWNRRKQLADEQNKLLSAHPELIPERYAGRESIDFFMDNPDWSAATLDSDKFYTRMAGEMQNIQRTLQNTNDMIKQHLGGGSSQITADVLKWVPSQVRGYYERAKQYGWTLDKLESEMNDPNSAFSNHIKASIAATGIDNMNFGYSYDDEATANARKKEAYDRLYAMGQKTGVFALGKPEFETLKDEWKFMTAQQAFQARENEKNRQHQKDLAAAKAGNGKTQDSATPWNAKQHGVEFVKGNHESERAKKAEFYKKYKVLEKELGKESINRYGTKHVDYAFSLLNQGKSPEEIKKAVALLPPERTVDGHYRHGDYVSSFIGTFEKELAKNHVGLSKELEDLLVEHELGNIKLSDEELKTLRDTKDINSLDRQTKLNGIAKKHGLNKGYEALDDYISRSIDEYKANEDDMDNIRNDKALSTLGSITNFANSKNADQQVIGKLGALGNDTELSELNETNGKKTGKTKKVKDVIGMINEDGAQTRYSTYNNSDGIGIAVNITEKSGEVHEYRLPYAAVRGWEGISDITGNNIYANDIEGSTVGQANAIAYKSNITTADKKKLIELGYYHEENGKKIPYTRREILQMNESLRGNVMNELTRQWDLTFKPGENNNQQYSDGNYYWQQD